MLENTQSRSIVGIGDIVSVENDFERIWRIGDRYISIVLAFGPKLLGTLMQMELNGELDVLARDDPQHGSAGDPRPDGCGCCV